MGLLELFVTASVPVMKVLLVTGVGSFLATGSVGILCHEARKHLNNVVFYVFNPALVSTNLSRTITMESLVLLWFMPINILLTFIFGLAFGWVVIQITNAPSNLQGLVLGCCAAGNLGNMLLIIVPAICKERGSPFGASDVCTTYGLAYASLSMAIGAIFLWSFVYNIVRISSGATGGNANAYSDKQEEQIIQETEKLVPQSCLDRTLPIEHTYLPGEECVLTLSATEIPQNELKIIGFVIGVVPQIRKAIIGETAPLRVIQDSADLLGEGAIPTLTLIMGGNLIKGLRGSGIQFSLILGVVIVRYILLPLVGILVVKGAINLGLLHQDPLYHFILLLQYALPPAMNIGTITQLFGTGESECSVIFLWTYSLASVALTLWSTYFMWLVSTN